MFAPEVQNTPYEQPSHGVVDHVVDMVSYGVPFRLAAESPEMIERMRRHAPYGSATCMPSASGARSFAVRAAQSGTTYQVLADGELLVDGEAMAPALVQLGGHLMIHVAEYAPEFVFVHAGVVAWQGRALLLPGVSHAGKSTLVAELVRAGATYYSDEFALLDSHGRVHPFARDLRIRRPGKPDQTSVPVTHLKGRAGTQALHRRDDRLHRIRAGCLLGSATGIPCQSRAGNAAAYRARAANPGEGPGHCFHCGAKCRRLEVFARRSRSGCAGPYRCPGRGRSAGMRPGMHLLLALLRGEASAGDGSAEQWGAALDIARQENILLWTAARLRSIPGALPPGLDARLRQIHRDAQVSAFFWTSTLRSILADFHERGIPVVSLKGPWMAERLCGDAALRPCTDLDLLVRPVDLVRSEALLSQLGFMPRRHRDDHERPWCRETVTVDLHHDVEHPLAFDFDVKRAWEQTLPSDFQGVPARLLAPADELLFLCLHSARHRFERLSHSLDLTFAFQKLPLPCAGSGSRRDDEVARLVAFGSMMAARLDPCCTAQLSLDLPVPAGSGWSGLPTTFGWNA